MKQEAISKTLTGGKFAGTVDCIWSVPESLEEAVQVYGEPVVFSHFIGSFRIAGRRVLASAMKAARDPQEAISTWVPGLKKASVPKKPSEAQVLDAIRSVSDPEVLRRYLEEIKAARAVLQQK